MKHNVPSQEQRGLTDLNPLRVFHEVARTLSVTEAARRLDMPKSSVSRDVARLEKDLGVLLLARGGRRFTLTETGTLLAEHAAQILTRITEATDAVATRNAMPHGRLVLQTTWLLGYAVLMPLLPAFLARYPLVDVALDLENHGAPPSREWDVRLATGPLEDSSFAARQIAEMKLGLYASADYLTRRGHPPTAQALKDHDIVDKHWPRGFSPWEAPGGGRPLPVKPRLLLGDLLAVAFALQQGAGIGWLPSFLAAGRFATTALVPVLPELCRPPMPVYAIFPVRRSASPKIQAFVDFLAQAMS